MKKIRAIRRVYKVCSSMGLAYILKNILKPLITHVHARTHVHAHTHVHTRVQTRTRAHTHKHTYATMCYTLTKQFCVTVEYTNSCQKKF